MQHFFNFAVEFDDQKITDQISRNAETQITKEIGEAVKKNLFKKGYSYSSFKDDYDRGFTDSGKEIIDAWLTEHKDIIISKTAELLADKLARTKAAKAVVEEIKQ